MTGGDPSASELRSLQTRLAVVEATLAICELKARYGELVDSRYSRGAVLPPDALEHVVNQVVELFAEDARWDGGPKLGIAVGRHQIAERLRRPTLVFSRHFFVKPRIEVDLPSATVSPNTPAVGRGGCQGTRTTSTGSMTGSGCTPV